jgi:peptidoglycan hydrolase CwlO-like protein
MKYLYFALLLLINVPILSAQDIKVETVTRNMSQGEQPGFSVVLPKADVKVVETGLMSLLQGKSRNKPEKKNNEWVMMHTVIPSVTQDTVDIYARTISTTAGVVLEMYFKDSIGFVHNDRPVIHAQAEKFVYDFALTQRKATLSNQLEAAKDQLKSFEKEYSSLSKDLEKLSQGITKSKLEIDENTNKISTNESDQDRLRSQIQAQKKKVNEAAKLSPEAKKAEESNLKELEKELSSLIKEKEKIYKSTVKCETDVRDAELEIKNTEVAIDNKQKQIAEQNAVIKDLQDQLQQYK